MSKYYKAEDVIDTLAEQWHFEATIDYPYAADDIEEWKQNARELFADLPTIEVSEDFVKDTDVPISEDCISREYLKSFEYINKGDFNSVETIREWIDNAPSVVPTTEQSSMVGEWIDHYYPYFEVPGIECSVCGEDVPDWQSHHKKPRTCPNCGAKMRLK